MNPQIHLDTKALRALCERWAVAELSLFGSVLGEDFGSDSDVDVLVSFRPGAKWSLWDLAEMQQQLEALFGRPVDLVEKEGLRNPYRRRAILDAMETVYAA